MTLALIDFLFLQECTIYPWERTYDGEDFYGPPQVRKCRLQTGSHLRQTFKGADGVIDQCEAHAKLYCTGTHIPPRSKVECNGLSYIVIDCYDAHGFIGDHLEVDLQ